MDCYNDDILTLRLIKQGNKEAFKKLFDQYFTPLCRFMHLYLKNKQSIEEMALDIFAYIWEHRDTLSVDLSIKAYIFQSAKNKCINHIRDLKETVSFDEFCVEVEDSIHDTLEIEELSFIIQEAVLSLPNKCREIFELSRVNNYTNQEIADKLHISIKTVESQITKALKRIKNQLGDNYFYLW